jgi:hypothetical protein
MNKLLFLFLLISSIAYNQCNQYQIYESFTSTLPTQGGTWTSNSMISVTTPVKTGTHSVGFNGTGDWIRTPQIATPGVLTFWYRRSSNTTAWTLNIQTSPDGTTWTTRGSITAVTTTYQQYTLNIGALSLTNVFIRLLDARASGAQERYVDDLAITSTTASTNTLLPILGACTQTLTSSLTYTLSDDGGPAGPSSTGYANNVDRTITLTPSDNTKKLKLAFTQLSLETTYDYLYVYDGANTSATLLATLNGTSLPSNIIATNPAGQLTLRWTTDVSNVGTWGGFAATITSITPLINDNPSGAIELTIANVVTYATYTNVNATNTTTESTPSCAAYVGEDVWFKVTLPQYLTSLDFDTQIGGITDAGMAIYRGTLGALVEIQCDDDSSPNGAMSYISRTDFNQYETIYIRIWEYNGGTVGTFGISVTSPQPLPVELLYFTADKEPTYNLVHWATASENNSSHFILERSTDGMEWRTIETVTAAGNSTEKLTYNIIDATHPTTLNYYRLLQYDIDGQFATYGPIAINNNKTNRIVRTINLMGQEVDATATGICIEVYEDGTLIKVLR